MLRKMLAVFLVITMIVSLAACAGNSNKKDVNVGTSNVNDTTAIGGDETTVTDSTAVQTETSEKNTVDETNENVIGTDADDSTTTTNTDATIGKTTTAKGEQNGSTVAKTSTTTSKKTTATSKKSTTTTKKTTATTANQNNSDVIYKSHKLIRVERVDMGISMVGNEHMLDYYLGKNKYFNSDGDILVYQFEFKKGSLADCRVGKDPVNCDAIIEGNLLKITLKNDSWQPWAWVGIENSKGKQFTAISIDNLIKCDGPIINNDPAIKQVFLIYAKQKYGIEEWKITLDDCDGYTADWRKNGGKDPSVTKQHGGGNMEDDFFYKSDVDDWVGYLEYILKEYSKMEMKKWSVRIAPTFICIRAK